MDIAEAKSWVEKHLTETGSEFRSVLTSFVDWVDGKQSADKADQEAITLLTSHGYTVTKEAAS